MRSQDTTDVRPVVLPFWMAKEVALDLSEKERLEEMAEITSLQLFRYQVLVEGLEKNTQNLELQVELLRRKNELLEGQVEIKSTNHKDSKTIFLLKISSLALIIAYVFFGL